MVIIMRRLYLVKITGKHHHHLLTLFADDDKKTTAVYANVKVNWQVTG